MSSVLNLNCDTSDSEDDQDYVPQECADSDDSCSEHSDDAVENESVPARKSRSGKTKRNKRNIKRAAKDEIEEKNTQEFESKSEVFKVDEKKRVDDLFKSFLEDVQPIVRKPSSSAVGNKNSQSLECSSKSIEKKVLTEEYEFAGETVTVTKDVGDQSPSTANNSKIVTATAGRPAALKRPGGGLSSLVGALNKKKQKISTLEKSLLDWNNFKKDEGISEELEHHNKGKEGYIERQAFLQRSDLRQFEIERNMRLTKRGQH